MRSSLFKGMGILCGSGYVYVDRIINRDCLATVFFLSVTLRVSPKGDKLSTSANK